MRGALRVAFVGAGRMARLHVHALRRVRTPHVVAAVCDTSEASARGLAELVEALPYGSLTDLLREAKPDIVHVCTPAGTHFAPARQALLAGAHVYVEKPFVEIESEARELLALARSAPATSSCVTRRTWRSAAAFRRSAPSREWIATSRSARWA